MRELTQTVSRSFSFLPSAKVGRGDLQSGLTISLIKPKRPFSFFESISSVTYDILSPFPADKCCSTSAIDDRVA